MLTTLVVLKKIIVVSYISLIIKSLYFITITAIIGIIYEILLKRNIIIHSIINIYRLLGSMIYKYKINTLFLYKFAFINLITFMIYNNYKLGKLYFKIFINTNINRNKNGIIYLFLKENILLKYFIH